MEPLNARPATPGRILAPATAFLLLAGLLAPAASGGPLGLPEPAAGQAFNVLALGADGRVVAWQDAGGSRTAIHLQGVAPAASGFNLVDPLGRLVGLDRSSSVGGSVDFPALPLVSGTYTLLGPDATGVARVLATYGLEPYATQSYPAFVPPASSAAKPTAQVCQSTPAKGVHAGEFWVRSYGTACVLRLDGTDGCLLDAETYCAWAQAWAWAVEQCPGGNTDQCQGLAAQQDTSPCDLCITLFEFARDTARAYLNFGLDVVACSPADNACALRAFATGYCPPGGGSGKCDVLQTVAVLALYLHDESGEGQPDPGEYVHAGYFVNSVFDGDAVQAEISVGGQCNRADLHAISSWISMMTYDDAGNEAYWWQTGYDQPWDPATGVRCEQAMPFYQSYDVQADAYTRIFWASAEPAPVVGTFTLAFDTVNQNPTLAPASASPPDCLSRLLAGKTCPMVLNPPTAGSCPLQGPWNATCTARRGLMQDFLASAPTCPELPGLLANAPGLPTCQAAVATRAILGGASIPPCDAPGALDGWVCIKPTSTAPQAGPADVAASSCAMHVRYNGHPIANLGPVDHAVGPSGCKSGRSEVVYEVAQDWGDPLSPPGSQDLPSGYDQWSGMSQYGWEPVEVYGNMGSYYGFAGSCPDYNLKVHWIDQFIGPGTLYIHNDEGPNIPPQSDGTPYCGQADSATH